MKRIMSTATMQLIID